MAKGPVLIELDEAPNIGPVDAPPVEDPRPPAAMEQMIRFAGRPPSRLVRWFWGLLATLVVLMISVAFWDFVTGLLAKNAVLGGIATMLAGLLLVLLLLLAFREAAAFVRLARLDNLQRRASEVKEMDDARDVSDRLLRLYAPRPELEWHCARFRDHMAEAFDPPDLLMLAERDLLAPLDAAAAREVEVAARQVATVTAIVPLAFADVVVALVANLRMIRRVAEVYGGRSGVLGNWRLTRSVLAHLVATGAVAVGDDLIGAVAGGGIVSKLSRRFGEGLINGALTARVGVAAMDVCRPMAFKAEPRPSVTGLVRRALTGVFGNQSDN